MAGRQALAVCGCSVLVLTASSGPGEVRLAGVLLALLAGGCYGLYTTTVKVLLDRGTPPVAAMVATLGLAAAFLCPALIAGGAALATPGGAVLVAWLGVVTTAAAYLMFARGLRRLPASTAGRTTNTVHLGPDATRVRLAWVDPAKTRRAPFPAPE